MKYHIITYGCQMNKSDSERIAAKLEKKGYLPAKEIKRADLVVINVCSVRQSAVNRVYDKVKKLNEMKTKPKIVLTGCLLEKDKRKLKGRVDSIRPIIDFKTKPKRQSLSEAFVPIMNGCDNFCSYCVVPYTRGREYSRPSQEIIKEVRELAGRGCKKITLLGQNVNSYKDETQKINFPKLLDLICKIPGDFKVKFLTSHPKDMSDALTKIISQNKKISKEIHLAIQSGDDKILKAMNRKYAIKDCKKLIKKIRQIIPEAKISTDIIVGFPRETEKQFQNTIKVVKDAGFYQIYAAAYSPRPGTAALKMKDDVPPNEKKRRKRIILDLIKK
ncbi:MAG: MiaB/RimO family radical SAM methylthiotransferase [Patescibacteria group bacterium]|nr:MiaB/RimO family radical SAM methylthiotransferase [Patescibacteria group bacterium]